MTPKHPIDSPDHRTQLNWFLFLIWLETLHPTGTQPC